MDKVELGFIHLARGYRLEAPQCWVGVGPLFVVSERKSRSGGEGGLPKVTRVVGAELGQVGFPCVSFVTSLAGLWAAVKALSIGESQSRHLGPPFCISFPWRPSPVILAAINMLVSLHLRPLASTLNSSLSVQLPSWPSLET